MTKTQKETIEHIKSKLNRELTENNESFKIQSTITYDTIETEYFVSLVAMYKFNGDDNVFNNRTIQLFIGKRGKVEGFVRGFRSERKINKFWQIYL